MHKTQTAILQAYTSTKQHELTTSGLVAYVYPSQYKSIAQILQDPIASKETKEKALEEKAKYHRRITHHLNKLVQSGILECTKVLAKGEKCYAPKSSHGEELVVYPASGQRITITRPTTLNVPMQGFEHKRVVHKVMADEWATRLNAVVIEGTTLTDASQAKQIIKELCSIVNDVVGINDVQAMLQTMYISDILQLMQSVHEDAVLYDKRINVIIDMQYVDDYLLLLRFIKFMFEGKFTHFTIVFKISTRQILSKTAQFQTIVSEFGANKAKLNFHNKDVYPNPILIGKAGPYTTLTQITTKDNSINQQNEQQNPIVIRGAGLCGVVIDVDEFFLQFSSANVFKQAIMDVAKSLFIANTQLRSHIDEYLKTTKFLHKINTNNLFSNTNNYIRLWNYDPSIDPQQRQQRIHLLQTIKEELDAYVQTQKLIYFSCGMPTSFAVSFAVAYRRFDANKLLQQKYENIQIKKTDDIYEEKNKQMLFFFEAVDTIMQHANEVRIKREGLYTASDIMREVTILLTSCTSPLFCFEFEKSIIQPQSLTSYLQSK